MSAGDLDKRVTIMFRPNGTGPLTKRIQLWAAWHPAAANRRVEAHGLTDGVEGQLRMRDTPRARAITQADRAQFSGQDFGVLSAPVPDRSGWLWIKIGREIGSG